MKKIFISILIMMLFITNIQNTFAYSNYDTQFDITISEFGFMNQIAFNNKTYKEVFDDIISTETTNYFEISVGVSDSNKNISPSNYTIYITNSYPLTEYISYYNKASSTQYNYNYMVATSSVVYKYLYFENSAFESNYNEIISCIQDYDSCSWRSITGNDSRNGFEISTSISNDDDYSITLPSNKQTSKNTNNFPLYANFNLTLGSPTQAQLDATNQWYKNIYINGNLYTTGMSLPTYYDLYYSNVEPDEPDEPIEPDDDSIFTHIYWFFDNSDNYGVLANIYILLFLYCITNLILKFYSIIKVKNRR